MPVAIRMANGATYYPEGFEHFSNPFKKQKTQQTLRPTNPTGGNKETEYMRRYTTYGKYWADKGEDPVPNPDSTSPIKWVSKDTAAKMEASIREGNFDYTGSGKVGDFVRNAPHKLARAGEKIGTAAAAERGRLSVGYQVGQRQYDREKGEKGNAFGRTAAGVAGAVKNSTAYNVGKAAVGKAGSLIATGAGKAWGGIKSAGQFVGGKAVGAAKFVADKTVKAGGKIAELARGAASTVANSPVGKAASTVASDFKTVAKAIGNTAVGKAALTAGRAALSAGGNAVQAVGNALRGIGEFFKGKYESLKGKYDSFKESRALNKELKNKKKQHSGENYNLNE